MVNQKAHEALMTVLENESQVVKDIWALYVEQYKHKEIAEKLNLNLNTVASHIHRLKDKLQQCNE
jgi:DNA-directed RNA polymerase specialized sigma24 family protein